jgi:hypothetical protein
MAVTSSTVAGINTWTVSGAVTDADFKTAWAGLIVNGVYVLNRAIYLDDTADISGVTGGFLVDFGTQVLPAFIFHDSGDRTKQVFNNFTFLQRTGLTVANRSLMIRGTNGTILTAIGDNGLSQKGGGFVYGVEGVAPGGGDNRYLNELPFGSLEGVTIYSQEFALEELQIIAFKSAQLKGLTFEKAYGFPQLGTPTGNNNVVVYRSNQNTQSLVSGGLIPIRLFPSGNRYAAVCYVDSYITRNNADITTRLISTFGTNASNLVNITILNNFTRESWFGATKTTIPVLQWYVGNTITGGVLKKLQFVGGDGGVVRCYDSRSTTAAQKCSFQETGFIDFLDTNLAPTTDAEGKISLVHVGATAAGATGATSATITRYNNQRFTFQKFGFRVQVATPDMTSGDNDLSAFAPVILTEQEGITRTQAAITAATSIDTFQQLLEEIHVLSLGLTGAASYSGAFTGNLASFAGGILTTNFASVTVDKTAAAKITYDSAANTLVILSDILTDTETVQRWSNPTGPITIANGAAIQGVYQSSVGTSTIIELRGVSEGASIYIGNNATGVTKLFQADASAGVYRAYFEPSETAAQFIARELYGFQRQSEVIPLSGGLIWYQFVDVEDVGITEPTLATVQAYTAIETASKFYDRTAAFRLTEQGIKLGQMVTRSGRALETGSFSHVVNKDATLVYSVTGSVITTKSVEYAGDDKYDTEILTPPATLTANTTEVITIQIEDANGDSQVSINGGDGTFELWKVTTATATNDYATGTLLDTVGNGIYRFIGEAGFDIVGVDINSNIRRRSSMAKGITSQSFYVGDQIQLAQAPQVVENGIKLDVLAVELESLKGDGYTTAKNSLASLRKHVTNMNQA